MKLLVLTCGVFPTFRDVKEKLWIFFRSCEKFGIEPMTYGMGETFPGYRQMMLDMQLRALKMLPKQFSHVLFTDGWDAFFCAPLEEIISKYKAMGAPPILCSAYIGLGNESDMSKYAGCFDESIPYRYPNRGGYLAEIPAIIEAFTRMLAQDGLTGDDCMEWYRGWREGWFRPKLDSNCEIFQVSDVNAKVKEFHEGGPRLYNTVTRRMPCILHLSGGYTDQVTGKDHVMVPWARALGVI